MKNDNAKLCVTKGNKKVVGYRAIIDGRKCIAYLNGNGELESYEPFDSFCEDFYKGEFITIPKPPSNYLKP